MRTQPNHSSVSNLLSCDGLQMAGKSSSRKVTRKVLMSWALTPMLLAFKGIYSHTEPQTCLPEIKGSLFAYMLILLVWPSPCATARLGEWMWPDSLAGGCIRPFSPFEKMTASCLSALIIPHPSLSFLSLYRSLLPLLTSYLTVWWSGQALL